MSWPFLNYKRKYAKEVFFALMGKSNKLKLIIPLVIFVAMVVISASGCVNRLKTSNSDQAKNNPAQAQNQSSAYSSQPANSGSVNPASNAGPSENVVVLSIASIRMVSDQVGWAVGQRGQVLRTEDGGATWSDVTPSEMGQISILPSCAARLRFRTWGLCSNGTEIPVTTQPPNKIACD